jgi:hypothetical protein
VDATGQWRISSDYTRKIYQLGDFAVGTAGWNLVNDRTIEQHMEHVAQSAVCADINAAANAIKGHFEEQFTLQITANPGSAAAVGVIPLQFLLAGCAQGIPHIKRIDFFQSSPTATTGIVVDAVAVGAFNTAWIGMVDVVCRLFNGAYFPDGIDPTAVDLIRVSVPQVAGGHFSLQDGINFVMFGIEATIRFQRFTFGHSTATQNTNVGGAIDVAIVTERGFEWKKKKDLAVRSQFSEDGTDEVS